jgi:7-cyano-7-deazaguanine synthase in queuosine biosynthesis
METNDQLKEVQPFPVVEIKVSKSGLRLHTQMAHMECLPKPMLNLAAMEPINNKSIISNLKINHHSNRAVKINSRSQRTMKKSVLSGRNTIFLSLGMLIKSKRLRK